MWLIESLSGKPRTHYATRLKNHHHPHYSLESISLRRFRVMCKKKLTIVLTTYNYYFNSKFWFMHFLGKIINKNLKQKALLKKEALRSRSIFYPNLEFLINTFFKKLKWLLEENFPTLLQNEPPWKFSWKKLYKYKF